MMVRAPTMLAVATLVVVLVVAALIVTGSGGGRYVVSARFVDASQLVKGNVVEVGGRRVGEVTGLELTADGQAEVRMTLNDDSVKPLHQGTRAAVRTIGLSGVANRFVDLTPGPPTAPEIPDGGVIPTSRTRAVVDLDVLLNAIDPAVRRDIRGIIRDAATALTPTTARQTNRGLQMLNPAVSRLTTLARELTADDAALRSLLTRTASLSTVLSRHRASLGSGLGATATTLEAVASEREALGDALDRAPAVMATTRRTLRRVRTGTLPAVEPFLRDARPVVAPLGRMLDVVGPTLENAVPVMRRIRALLPEARQALAPLPDLHRRASPALKSATKALGDALPLISGLRPYTPDLVAGLFLGFGGSQAGYYDANGHYARVALVAGSGGLPGLLPKPPNDQLGGYRTGMDARCPGSAEESAPDRSNPWHDGAPGSCDPKDDR